MTVIGITDHSFTQPYILLSAHVPDDAGYFGERLKTAHAQLLAAWKRRAAQLDPHFPNTDIFGALQLASQIFARQPNSGRRTVVVFSDMRHNTPDLNLEALRVVPSFTVLASRCGPMPLLHGVDVYVLGVDGADKTSPYWRSLQEFWKNYLQNSGANLSGYTVLRTFDDF